MYVCVCVSVYMMCRCVNNKAVQIYSYNSRYRQPKKTFAAVIIQNELGMAPPSDFLRGYTSSGEYLSKTITVTKIFLICVYRRLSNMECIHSILFH